MKNKSLKSDTKRILKERSNINKIEKGNISNFSIEVGYAEPPSQSSYIYYDKESDRDEDFEELQTLIQ